MKPRRLALDEGQRGLVYPADVLKDGRPVRVKGLLIQILIVADPDRGRRRACLAQVAGHRSHQQGEPRCPDRRLGGIHRSSMHQGVRLASHRQHFQQKSLVGAATAPYRSPDDVEQGDAMTEGFTHGKHACGLCHAGGKTATIHEGKWQLIQTQGFWGDSDPHTLVLGFSMGANQVRAFREDPFDKVAFSGPGMRDRVRQILDALGIGRANQSIDETMTARSRGLGYSSLARCSLGLWDKKAKAFKTSGVIMKDAPGDPWAGEVLTRCASTYLRSLPTSIKRVVLFGSGDAYVEGVRKILRSVFDDFADINPMTFKANGRTWVFAVHPKYANRVKEWLTQTEQDKAGRKRAQAQQAIARSYADDESNALPSKIGTRRLMKRQAA